MAVKLSTILSVDDDDDDDGNDDDVNVDVDVVIDNAVLILTAASNLSEPEDDDSN